jgi:hypothetical protein
MTLKFLITPSRGSIMTSMVLITASRRWIMALKFLIMSSRNYARSPSDRARPGKISCGAAESSPGAPPYQVMTPAVAPLRWVVRDLLSKAKKRKGGHEMSPCPITLFGVRIRMALSGSSAGNPHCGATQLKIPQAMAAKNAKGAKKPCAFVPSLSAVGFATGERCFLRLTGLV